MPVVQGQAPAIGGAVSPSGGPLFAPGWRGSEGRSGMLGLTDTFVRKGDPGDVLRAIPELPAFPCDEPAVMQAQLDSLRLAFASTEKEAEVSTARLRSQAAAEANECALAVGAIHALRNELAFAQQAMRVPGLRSAL